MTTLAKGILILALLSMGCDGQQATHGYVDANDVIKVVRFRLAQDSNNIYVTIINNSDDMILVSPSLAISSPLADLKFTFKSRAGIISHQPRGMEQGGFQLALSNGDLIPVAPSRTYGRSFPKKMLEKYYGLDSACYEVVADYHNIKIESAFSDKLESNVIEVCF